MNGALLIHKHDGVSSFGIIRLLQEDLIRKAGTKRKDLVKMGHGGTLDPFATGLLIVLVGKAVKLARYFLGSSKSYEGEIRFGETTAPGDSTAPITETSAFIPTEIESLRDRATLFTQEPYHQIPPMFSAKKRAGKPLYELARAGIEVEREAKTCSLYQFEITKYSPPLAHFKVVCSSGTYVRTLAQDFAKSLGSVALLNTLCRTSAGVFQIEKAWETQKIIESTESWDTLPCWIPFDQLLGGYARAQATSEERQSLFQGKQEVLQQIIHRTLPLKPENSDYFDSECVAIYSESALIAIARKNDSTWSIERVFC